MRRSVWVVLALLSVLFVPSRAYASDVDYVGSFSSGFQALTGNGSNAEVRPEQEFIEEYEPVYAPLSAGETAEDDTPLTNIQSVAGVLNRIPAGGVNLSMTQYLRYVLKGSYAQGTGGTAASPVVIGIGLVFLWWGVRKVVRMLFKAFRKGSASV